MMNEGIPGRASFKLEQNIIQVSILYYYAHILHP